MLEEQPLVFCPDISLMNKDNLFHWICQIRVTKDSPYHSPDYPGGLFVLKIEFPGEYPFKPPKLKFLRQKVFHPNVVFETGKICSGIIGEWAPHLKAKDFLTAVYTMLQYPEFEYDKFYQTHIEILVSMEGSGSGSNNNQTQQEKQESDTPADAATNHLSHQQKAWNFVHDLMQMHKDIQMQKQTASLCGASLTCWYCKGKFSCWNCRKSNCGLDGNCWNSISNVAVDNLVYFVQNLLRCQDNYRLCGKGTHVDIGYHYTNSKNLKSIGENGLLSRPERAQRGISEHQFRGASYGDGIYTGNNPFAYSSYGRNGVGLLVLRLKGQTNLSSLPRATMKFKKSSALPRIPEIVTLQRADTTIAKSKQFTEMVILHNTFQCVPVFLFPQEVILPPATMPNNTIPSRFINPDGLAVWHYHTELQSLVDRYFNDNVPTKVNIIKPLYPATRNTMNIPLHPPPPNPIAICGSKCGTKNIRRPVRFQACPPDPLLICGTKCGTKNNRKIIQKFLSARRMARKLDNKYSDEP